MAVEFYRHSLGEEEAEIFRKALSGTMLTTGHYAHEAENRFQEYLGISHCVVLDSCTAALHLALLACDIGPGDEVITTPMTFVATANSVLMTGAKPVFVDVEKATGNIDAKLIEAAITPRTKAIMPVHLYGHLCDMQKIKMIADRHGLAVIEDAAHCIEGIRDSVRPGRLGTCACFSFYATKNVTCGEGGMLATNDAAFAARVRRLSCHGIDKTAYDRYGKSYKHWDVVELGWKYNLDNLRASLLIPQIPKIDRKRNLREKVCRHYEKAFDAMGLEYPIVLPGTTSARHMQSFWIQSQKRDETLLAMQEKGIGVAVNYRVLTDLKYFKDTFSFKRGLFPEAERIGDSTITVPLYPDLTLESVDEVLRVLKKCL
jgi:UDP-4-amino-4-deoxy-L-arabinose-oxoglutarate aminotransferase